MRLLLIEDDWRIAHPTLQALTDAGHEMTFAADGLRGLALAQSGDHDVLLLDIMLPGCSGFEIARTLRAQGQQTPIIFLTARSELQDRVDGLDLGGDAYLVKPIELPELHATLRAVVRRGVSALSAQVSFGQHLGLLNTRDRQVWWRGELVGCTAREYALLETLVLARGRWFTRDELLTRVWGPEFEGNIRVVDVYVSYLRRKLEQGALLTSRGMGYCVP